MSLVTKGFQLTLTILKIKVKIEPGTEYDLIKVMGNSYDQPVWPAWTNIIPPSSGGKLALGLQTTEVVTMIHTAIELAHISTIFDGAFALPHVRDQDMLQCLITAAEKHEYEPIARRLKKESSYAHHPGKMVRRIIVAVTMLNFNLFSFSSRTV